MNHINNRMMAVIKLRQPFLDWLKTLPEPLGEDTTLHYLRGDDCTSLLVPDADSTEGGRGYVFRRFQEVFEYELWSWHTEMKDWPKKRNLKMFKEWFDVEVHSEVIDMLDSPVEKEEDY